MTASSTRSVPETFKRTPLQIAVRKRAEALASIVIRQRQIAELEARIASLDATIAGLGGLPKPRPLRIPYRCGGLVQRTIFDMFRESAGPITSADVAVRIAAHYGLSLDDPLVRRVLRARAVQALNRLRHKGLARCVGKGEASRKGNPFGLWLLVLHDDLASDEVF